MQDGWVQLSSFQLCSCERIWWFASRPERWFSIFRFDESAQAIWPIAIFYGKMSQEDVVIEGSLEVKFPTIWRDGKAEVGRVREETSRSEKIREEKEWEARRCRCAKRQESRDSPFFSMIWGSTGSKTKPAGQMRDEKNPRRCGAKHIFKSKCAKHPSFGALWEVEMSKKCTPLWREENLEKKK